MDHPSSRPVAEVLKRCRGWEIYGFSVSTKLEELSGSYSGLLDLYTVIDAAKSVPLPEDIVTRCQNIEVEYDVNLADIILADRHLGIGWVTGGLYHRGKMSYLPYTRHLYIIERVFHAVREFADEVGPSFVCAGGVGSFEGAIIYVVCERMGVPVVSLNQAIANSYYYWNLDRYSTVPGLEEAYRRIKGGPLIPSDEPVRDVVVPDQDAVARVFESRKLLSHVRNIAKASVHKTIEKLKGLDPPAGEITVAARLRYHLQLYRNFRNDMRREYTSLSEATTSDYIYFPLHMEPESSLLGVEPHFTNQTYAIELLSKSVPAGVDIFVKEHWNAVGTRPAQWLDIIAGFPRVKLLHPFENSIEIIRNCLATATIAGSAGAEAAIRGVPVISLGPNYRYNFVDHVFFANDLIKLRKIFKSIRNNRDSMDYSRDAAALRQAFDTTCFNPYSDLSTDDPVPADVELVCDKLLNLLNTVGVPS